ncbi:MAG: acetyl-CoA synthase subunit gamma [Deltaproteobacteria bacterium]|nr:acetyl-CoA synthase subunit gamma [Deltaproteobacteria bacterium]
MPRLSSEWRLSDHWGAWKARWGIGRLTYLVPPGLYAIGSPGPEAEVAVTCNYKMTFDLLRRELAGRDLWVLVLETHGINVWCAAGKGTFGTGELVRRVEAAGLAGIVSHRRLLLPVLGAPGVAAHEVKRRTGFEVSYAAVRASDLPAYLDNGHRTTPAMRELTFSLRERLVLVPVEVVMSLKLMAVASLVVLGIGTALSRGSLGAGLMALVALWGAMLTGTLLTPLLLPWLPGPSFALKGAVAGLAWSTVCWAVAGSGLGRLSTVALFLALPAVSAWYALNFTGCTPFTSLSGVKREVRIAVPALGCALGFGALLWVAGSLL